MKKVTFLLTTLLVGGMMLTGCKKDNPQPTPTPTPAPTAYTVVYKVGNSLNNSVLSPCFKLEVTYLDANGQAVTESNITPPWEKAIEVTRPFHAKMDGTFSYNEAELPETVVYGRRFGIGGGNGSSINVNMTGAFSSSSKEAFLNLVAEHPDRLKFSTEKDF